MATILLPVGVREVKQRIAPKKMQVAIQHEIERVQHQLLFLDVARCLYSPLSLSCHCALLPSKQCDGRSIEAYRRAAPPLSVYLGKELAVVRESQLW